MGIFNQKSHANKYAERGYERAQESMLPYTQYAGDDFNFGRNKLYSMMNQYGQAPNYNKQFYDYLDLSPQELLNQAMGGYETSPMTDYQQKYMQSALDNNMNAKGMGGSPNQELLDSEIASILNAQGMQQYLGNLLGTYGVQHQILGDYRQQGSNLAKMFQSMLGVENKASNTMAGNAMRTGQIEANSADRNSANHQRMLSNLFHSMLRIPGDAYFMHELFSGPRGKGG